MRAFQVTELGKTSYTEAATRPEPGNGQVLIEIKACALNFADLLMVKGTYQEKPALPFSPGMEVAGEVVAHGKGVKHPAIGTRVAVFGGHGGLAEFGVFPAELCVALPDAMDFRTAAAFQVAYSIELGKLMGAKVIAAARGADKLDVAKQHGADHLIDTDKDDLREVVKALGGADVVYDPVGGPLFTAAMRSCKPEARMLTIGFASGDVPQIAANHLLVKNVF